MKRVAMSDVLAKICDDKRRHVAARKKAASESDLRDRAAKTDPPPRGTLGG